MTKEKHIALALFLVFLQFIIWIAFGYGVFVYTRSVWLVLLFMLLLFGGRFCTHIFWFLNGRRLLKKALWGLSYSQVNELSMTEDVIWSKGTISLNKRQFRAHTAVTKNFIYIYTGLLFPEDSIVKLVWCDIAQIRVASPVRAIIYFKTPTEVELTMPWKSSYEAYVPKSVGFQKDEVYRYKN